MSILQSVTCLPDSARRLSGGQRFLTLVLCIGVISVALAGCEWAGEVEEEGEIEMNAGPVVAWGEEVPEERISLERHVGYSDVSDMALIRLEIKNIPEEDEGRRFTIIGGGADGAGLHGQESTGFHGSGYYFAAPRGSDTDRRTRNADYEGDNSRAVHNGRLVFDIYYEPTDISDWGDSFFEGAEVALKVVRSSTDEGYLYNAEDEEGRWPIGVVGTGNTGHITIDVQGEDTTEDGDTPVDE